MTTFPRSMMVKQFLAEFGDEHGRRFRVFTTGDDKYWLFDPLDEHGCSRCLQFPVLKSRLKPEVRRVLARGCSYVVAPQRSTICRMPQSFQPGPPRGPSHPSEPRRRP